MIFTLIVCTYKRHKALLELLNSVRLQSLYPNEILIIDASEDDFTKEMIACSNFENLKYFKVAQNDRGLTKQRNFGIKKLNNDCEIVCFLDDDTILDLYYFENLLRTYEVYPNAIGVGGYITNEVIWEKCESNLSQKENEFYFDGYKRIDGTRFVWRKKLGLDSNCPPGWLPEYSHGRSIGFIPPSNKIYQVEQLMGGVSSFRKGVFIDCQFSTYFEGYGLYEDTDFSLRVAKMGNLYINTEAKLEHHHDSSGRPNKYKYGKMVVRNGWYVWRVKYSKPSLNAIFKWHAITLLLILIRASNSITTSNKKEALSETLGRIVGWFSLFINKPVIRYD